MEFNAALKIARELIDAHGYAHVPIKKDNSFKRIAGCCQTGFSVLYFTFSKRLVPLLSDADLRDTILHEIAHAKVGYGHGHDNAWKLAALAVGARPERCATQVMDAHAIGYKYVAACNCGPIHGKQRMSYKRFKCGRCGVSLEFKQVR
jgi:predicted SprT family Zn-dependent metalloprotease